MPSNYSETTVICVFCSHGTLLSRTRHPGAEATRPSSLANLATCLGALAQHGATGTASGVSSDSQVFSAEFVHSGGGITRGRANGCCTRPHETACWQSVPALCHNTLGLIFMSLHDRIPGSLPRPVAPYAASSPAAWLAQEDQQGPVS